jgi:hypothetical protein
VSDHLGPVEFLALEFPDGVVNSEALRGIVAQMQAGNVFVIDLEFVVRPEGQPGSIVTASSLNADDAGLAEFDGASSGLLGQDDVDTLAADLGPGSVVVVLIYEDRTMEAVINACEQSGAHVLAEGTVDQDELDAALA